MMRKINITLMIALVLALLGFTGHASLASDTPPVPEEQSQDPLKGPHTVYIPSVYASGPRQVLLGTYTDGYLGWQSTIDNEAKAIDSWSGKRMSILGTFIAIEDAHPEYNIPVPLGLIWDSGYTPFVNLETSKSLQYINAGQLDGEIRKMAQAFRQWREEGLTKNQNRKAFLAPLQEMNGNWVPYHGSPADFKAAYSRIQSVFDQERASSAVRWTFAPNGWSENDFPFENYFPGDALVEVNALSAYNSGYCPAAQWKQWDGPAQVYGPYIARMRAMAPSKPIFIAQTATTAYSPFGMDHQAKNQWLVDSYTYLANSPGVSGVIYFNKALQQACDWPFYRPSGMQYDGYRQGVKGSEFIYIDPEALSKMPIAP